MRALTKPPSIDSLFLRFFWYKEKFVTMKLRFIILKKMLALEKIPVYFVSYKNSSEKISQHIFLRFGGYFLQAFHLSLMLKAVQKITWTDKPTLLVGIETMLEYSWLIYRKDFITTRHVEFFRFAWINLKNPQTKFLLIKEMIFVEGKNIYQKHFVWLDFITTFFFLNIFFFVLFLTFYENKKLGKIVLNRYLIFYFGLDFCWLFFFNKYDEKFSLANRYLTIQTGSMKWSNFYLDRNYIFASSAQLYQAKKNFFFKFFFKNLKFKRFKRHRIKTKWIPKKFYPDGLYIWSWSSEILPFFVNKIFYIYNGQMFTWMRIRPGMVGYKFGQFSFTRKIHLKNINLKNLFKNITF